MNRLLGLILSALALSSPAFATNNDWSLMQVAGEETYRSAVVRFQPIDLQALSGVELVLELGDSSVLHSEW